MKKETFQYLYSFQYKNKEYIYLISKNYPFYFMEYNQEKDCFQYPDIEVFKELYDMFYHNNLVLIPLKERLKKLKESLLKININIAPFVRTTSGVLSLVLVLSMCGCTQTKDRSNNHQTEVATMMKKDDETQEIMAYFKEYDMDVTIKEYDGNDYIFAQNFINKDNKRQIILQSFEEFREYTQMDFTPTWEDVEKAFQDNQKIDDAKRSIILECLNNMKNTEELKDLDLSILYGNARRMQIQYLSKEEMQQTVKNESVYAYFDKTTGTVFLPNDVPFKEFEFIHEVLGHGTLAYRNKMEDSIVSFDGTNYLMLPTNNRYTGFSIGSMIGEGGANMIAHFATNDYNSHSFYEMYEEELRVIARLCNVSIGELLNHKGMSFYDLMYQNGISSPVEYIYKMDGLMKGQLYCEFSDLMERLLVDATEEKYDIFSKTEKEDILNTTIDIIRDSYFKDQKELSYDYSEGTMNYNFEEMANQYKDNMNHK